MENKTINVGVVAKIAEALKDLNDKVVFVGGAVVSLYTDDPAADEIRPTADIDFTVNIANISNFSVWNDLIEKLNTLGFSPDPFGHAICSYKYMDIPVDIMAPEDGPNGPSNKWYKKGFNDLWKVDVKEQTVNILSSPYYLASKFEAFNDRGKDFRTSHDLEDIIYILDNRTTMVDEIINAEDEVKSFIVSQFMNFKKKGILEEALIAHIHPIMLDERLSIVEEKLEMILQY
ncbi:nucleotidyl transferase AbiEii/AbiGii toxin family protein [Empedobacter stercoris]|uniref:nucleotidyl transferase AbiEii/AbiGii toxin family protein n=1 Tax=Empedobacter stercoris TaxID=1628248 RepID=UPI001CE037FB|nr:nucleotidyl transferase AbiEii/AbiGii toxin family protein [Empedobacter stercoris]MCA4781804.1 nucleotidyl transferase AbiEii/AbiGii toxin family protein [Empedobacter stercoris]